MPFVKGQPRPAKAGRKPGSPIKLIRSTVTSILESMNCSPVENLAKIANDEKVEVNIRRAANSDLMRYCYPQLRSIEHSGPGGGPIPVTAVDPYDAITRELSRIAERSRPAENPTQPND